MNQHQKFTPLDGNLRRAVAEATWRDESISFEILHRELAMDEAGWNRITRDCEELLYHLRSDKKPPLIDQFLTEYGLSTQEGVQLMRLAEALSRTTDAPTSNALISDKILGQDWLSHSGTGHTVTMSLTGRALYLTDMWLRWSAKHSRGVTGFFAKVGNAILRTATRTAIKALSSQFVFAETLDGALKRATKYGKDGYLFSFDMLGEAARTESDAEKYYQAYIDALDKVVVNSTSDDPNQNHSISIKLSALHPRYEFSQAEHVVPKIVNMLLPLAIKARAANVQITIDAEEAERLDISMDVLSALVATPKLKGWHGLGFVVQAYQRRALPLLDWLRTKSLELEAPLFIRLVKGAYWDSEIKRAQEMGLPSYPVYTRKEMTDLSYMACARKLLDHPECFSPQFATHNAHSISTIRELAPNNTSIEFQRLFGMGQLLHNRILKDAGISSRIYAPVGTQKDLLSYLIRRLLENGANSSFVNKMADRSIEIEELTRDPASSLMRYSDVPNNKIPGSRAYLKTGRLVARGTDLSNPFIQKQFAEALREMGSTHHVALPVIGGDAIKVETQSVRNPANPNEPIGESGSTDASHAKKAIETAAAAFEKWSTKSPAYRAAVLERAADLLEERAATFYYLAVKEAGKTWSDAIDEVREAVDFCRYYAERIRFPEFANRSALGVVVCISPWNFPLAIFMGQVCASLAAGNTVVAKPAEQTPLIAAAAVRLLIDAGVDPGAINFLPGEGRIVGEALVSNNATAGVCFTGSTATAKQIAITLAETGRSLIPLIAETGGINAMIVDSSALLEQTVDNVVSSAFQSAGQRCSALRILCVQQDIADQFEKLLSGAMDALRMGDPEKLDTDIGPVIDQQAKRMIESHITKLDKTARRIGKAPHFESSEGHYVAPAAFKLEHFSDLDDEVFGPVLHIVHFDPLDKNTLIDQINVSGYGLTLGIDSRIDGHCDDMSDRANVGNIYINRNQIGAVVGVQPFGGAGLSGTGPKAGGPLYLSRLSKPELSVSPKSVPQASAKSDKQSSASHNLVVTISASNKAQDKFEEITDRSRFAREISASMPPKLATIWIDELKSLKTILPDQGFLNSPAGETNEYNLHGRGVIISLLTNPADVTAVCARAVLTGNSFVQCNENADLRGFAKLAKVINKLTGIENLVQTVANIHIDSVIEQLDDMEFGAILLEQNSSKIVEIGLAVARRKGAILPILTPMDQCDRFVHERTITCNIAAAGGDISLLNA